MESILRPWAPVTVLLLLALAGGAPAAPQAAVKPQAGPPDVLLVTIDTLRADAPGFSGNPKAAATPVLDRLAAAGRVFTDAHAHNVVTLPSHTNILTGLYPFEHGVRENSGYKLGPSVPTLATILKGAGYATAAFVGAFPLDSQFGLDRGFDVYDDHYPQGLHPTEFVLPERRGDAVVAAARKWWDGHRGRKRFLWVHLFDPHAPYAAPEPFAKRYAADPYLGEVAATDSFLGPLLTPFLDGKEPPTLIAVTADHGEARGSHGELTHGLFAYEATLHVPLVLWGPGVKSGRDGRLARHVDLVPTILAATGVKAPEAPGLERPGSSLLAPPPAPGTPAADSYFESLSAALNRGWAPLFGLIRGDHKLILLPVPELYDLAADPGETTNLVGSQRRLAAELRAALPAAAVWPPPAGREEVSPEVAARLRALGYAGSAGTAKTSFGPDDDPKNLIDLDRQIHEVVDLYSRGRLDEAVAEAKKLVVARPSMPLGYSLLAEALLERGDLGEAIGVMEKARAGGVASDSLLRQLGLSLSEAGHAAEAVEVLRPLARAGDPDSNNALGLALSDAGRQDEAKAVLQGVLASDRYNSGAYEKLGLVALRQERWADARDASRKALDLNDRLPRAWNNLGVALYQLGQAGGALDAWERAVILDPTLWDALYNLGLKGAEHGRPEVARKALERFIAGAPVDLYGGDLPRARALLGRLREAAGGQGGG